jgi:hypothetical protein
VVQQFMNQSASPPIRLAPSGNADHGEGQRAPHSVLSLAGTSKDPANRVTHPTNWRRRSLRTGSQLLPGLRESAEASRSATVRSPGGDNNPHRHLPPAL